jgi:hypothetical protein
MKIIKEGRCSMNTTPTHPSNIGLSENSPAGHQTKAGLISEMQQTQISYILKTVPITHTRALAHTHKHRHTHEQIS